MLLLLLLFCHFLVIKALKKCFICLSFQKLLYFLLLGSLYVILSAMLLVGCLNKIHVVKVRFCASFLFHYGSVYSYDVVYDHSVLSLLSFILIDNDLI